MTSPLPPKPAVDEAALYEPVDLPLELRREILELEARVRGTHWEVLGLAWNAGPAEARAAYLERIRRFHPDRYNGRSLGTFKVRLDRIVQRLTEARDLLADPARRDAYARETAPPEEVARVEAQRLDDELRAQERRARLARSASLVGRAARGGEIMKRARAALEEGRFADAANDFLTLVAMDPRNAEARDLAHEARHRAAAAQAQGVAERARESEALGRLSAARALWVEAAGLDPEGAPWQLGCARLARLQGDHAEALSRAEAAARLAPADPRAAEELGLALAQLGRVKEARRALRRALAADGSLEAARAQLRKLRWRIFG
ncbi:J domain-containing protein [Anaeromyxobacter paludicola]|uniref:J domain-containing protein n=1 Tax=Anaeromyxobacter paludicola TaxID=2918171 RepID=A0ABM7X8R8_9BACT|nr:J domain-containing protein [Anaeromyxobacter paludicola]BDG08249.1 hypothetical protein AMPC_13620 [Anaeromyxobacter paludicola]